ncbi:MAG: Ig-like domain-containing protein, partial [archaeon]
DGRDEFGLKIGSGFYIYENSSTLSYRLERVTNGSKGIVGDFDNDGSGGGASLKTSILMNSEDADYLLYKLYDMNSQTDKNIYSVISGTIGGNVNDDRYHLENGADGLIISLSSGQWSNYVNSDYSVVYDSSTSSDNANDNVVSWIRYEESSSNVNFKNVGLWNGNNNEGLRIKYYFNLTSNSTDYGTYLLAFTKGDYNVIDQWISTIKTGILPVNFMTAPQNGSLIGGAGTMNVNLDAPISGSNFNSNTSFTANATINCLDGGCGYVDAKLQYCEGISCDNWVDVTENTDLSTSLTTKHCSDNLLNNNQCIISWNVNGNLYGTYRLNVLALSNVSIDARGETPNIVYINDITIPYVLIVEPLDGSNIGGIVTIKANASDLESGISLVEYKIDDGAYILMNLVSGFYQSDWDTSQQNNDLHSITVRAIDNENSINTDSISVNISNQQQLSNLQVNVVTDKSSYTANEWVYSTTTVLNELNSPVLNANVITNIYAPNGQLKKICNGLTNSNGIYICNYKLKTNDPTGTWDIFSNATKQGYDPESGFTTFQFTG